MATTKNLWQRLLEIQTAVSAIGKDATNPHHGFAYASSGAVLSSVRKAMNDARVICCVSVDPATVRIEDAGKTKSGGQQWMMVADMSLTWINPDAPDEREVQHVPSIGVDQSERMVGKALTYAEKYGILKQFHIPTDADDPDAGDAKRARSGNQHAAPAGERKPAPKAAPAPQSSDGEDWGPSKPAPWRDTCSECGDLYDKGDMIQWNGLRRPDAKNRHADCPGGHDVAGMVKDLTEVLTEKEPWDRGDPGPSDDDLPFTSAPLKRG